MNSNPDGEDPTGSSSLDTALLESLFYNEMMLLEDSSSSLLSSGLFSSLTASDHAGAPPSTAPALPATVALSHMDPSTIAERALLRHFGVTAETTPVGAPVAGAVVSVPDPLSPQAQHQQQAAAVRLPSWTGTIPAADDPALLPSANPIPAVVQPSSTLSLSLNSPPAAAHSTYPPVAPAVAPVATTSSVAVAPLSTGVSSQEQPEQQKLVSQFATLASRLGIRLPPQMIQSLLDNRQVNSASAMEAVMTAAAGGAASPSSSPSSSTMVVAPAGSTATLAALPPPPAVRELESVAEAAIAAVTQTQQQKRRPSGSDPTAASDPNSNSKAPAYSKRRKKPRLAECEGKLAQLQAENEVLKRHLTTITNQSHKLDAERKELERRMRVMLETGATPQEMDRIVQTFSDYYSDYGRRRHQELEFHLEQLQRLANPTNFTKMGLWTLGQQSSNPKKDPIAGILQQELNITPQQGKKILEQREKIREVCTNLSECLGLLGKLKALCEQKTKIFNDRMDKCREILTPRQVIKLLIWIDEHSAVLEKVCPGWGSEQIPTKPKKG